MSAEQPPLVCLSAHQDICGGDAGTGVNGCAEPGVVWIEFTDRAGVEMAAILCHRHAVGLRAGEDIWDEAGWYFDVRPYTVTSWRSVL